MYGVQNTDSEALQSLAMMQLRGKKVDASKFIATGAAFSDLTAVLLVGASLQSGYWVRVRESLKHQGNLLRSKCGALTIRPSGPANTPLRYVSAVH
jgi:hypothetical protein